MTTSKKNTVQLRAVSWLKPDPRNPRTHSKEQIAALAKIIKTFGFRVPILVDRHGNIICGHARRDVAIKLCLKYVPVICIDDLSPEQIRALAIADNKIAEMAGWNRELLADELKQLIDLDFDATLTGFEAHEIDLLIDDQAEDHDPDDAIPQYDERKPAVTRKGDLWQAGKHRLVCGDTTNPDDVRNLMNGEKAQMGFHDVPYNVRIAGNASGLGRIRHGNFAMATGEMSEPEYFEFLTSSFRACGNHSGNGSIHFVCMDWRHCSQLRDAGRKVFSELKNICVWVKPNAGMGNFYRSQHEFVFAFKWGKGPHINNFKLGQNGRRRTNVWTYAGVNAFKKGRLQELEMHPTVKPVAMVVDAIKDVSKRGGIVLDGFMGSGTTLIAAERTGRIAYGLEIDPHYVDVAIRRWQTFTGLDAIHATTGSTFTELARQRGESVTIAKNPARRRARPDLS